MWSVLKLCINMYSWLKMLIYPYIMVYVLWLTRRVRWVCFFGYLYMMRVRLFVRVCMCARDPHLALKFAFTVASVRP